VHVSTQQTCHAIDDRAHLLDVFEQHIDSLRAWIVAADDEHRQSATAAALAFALWRGNSADMPHCSAAPLPASLPVRACAEYMA
jgi:hypothetical protein